MRLLHIKNTSTYDTLIQLQDYLNGDLKEAYGEYILTFNNGFGNGVIRGIDFDWGLTLIDFNVNLVEVTKMIFENNDKKLVEFIFISEGYLDFKEEEEATTFMNFDRYQNIIISSKIHSKKVFIFPKSTQIKVNIIQLDTVSYKEKQNNNLSYLDKALRTVFEKQNEVNSYHHLGSYNLKIADRIKLLDDSSDTGIVKTLSIEGQLNLIMAMQILEHQKTQSKDFLSDSLSRDHIKKIHELSTYITDNISEPLSINHLSKLSGLGPKKLQTGFKVLYSKSVNEYIRDLKLEVSRDQLKNCDLTISEIVYSVGFKSRSYFSKIFFERYGILPKDYRNNIKKVKIT
ncbi:AraC family transcriptional regulator [Flavivirga aquatica]|uniref:AraC family transcriptional regulator n=1 Tax=Flavivirga aquatica TaxID=1849968 RepID=A0A1E5T7H3_9FLAO|nr:helix-turn-helix domain-containing protein [Flavivirga aquatica]OEK07332.1 AraC family transcriptional regulator [Flavivirga aquatica]